MLTAVQGRECPRFARRPSHAFLLTLIGLNSLLVGCAGIVTGSNSTSNTQSLSISNVQAGSATVTTAQVAWSTNIAATSAVATEVAAPLAFKASGGPIAVSAGWLNHAGWSGCHVSPLSSDTRPYSV